MSSNVILSIIVPCYNIEQYISKCVESLVNISIKKIEFIFVDNGSSDKTYDILLKHKDSRLHVYRKENEGPELSKKLWFGKS